MNLEQEKAAMMETDREFSRHALEHGVQAGFDAYMTDEAVSFQNNAMPFEGRDAINKMFEGSTGLLQWEPYYGDVGASGDLGFTLGKYTTTNKDAEGKEQISKGRYVTIWKKQTDGTWKFVFDSGIVTPE